MITTAHPVLAVYPAAMQSLIQSRALMPQSGTRLAPSAGPAQDHAERNPLMRVAGGMAIITASGILTKAGYYDWWKEERVGGYRGMEKALDAAMSDDEIRNVVLLIDTPGGSVDGLSAMGRAIYDARDAKPIYAIIDGMCCSAGYYLASQCTRIIAPSDAIIGSIGTKIMLYEYYEMFREAGIRAIPVDTGEHKSAGAMGTQITEAQQAEFQRLVDAFFADFLAAVDRGRNVPELESLADGRVWVGSEALDLGLIDEVAPIRDAIRGISEEADGNSSRRSAAYAAAQLRLAAVR